MAGDNRMRDPYSILGISRSADQTEIKAAWRSVAKKLHPDQNRNDPQAQSRFTEAGRAYDLLRDPDKRRRYDEMLNRTSFGGNSTSQAGGAGRAGKEPTFMEKRAERARAEAEAKARAEAEARLKAEIEAAARAKAATEARAKAEAQAKAAAGAEASPASEVDEETEAAFNKLFGARRPADTGAERAADDTASMKPEQPKAETKSEAPPRAENPKPEDAPRREEAAAPGAESETAEQVELTNSPARNLFSYLVQRLTRQAPAPERAPDLNIDAFITIEDLIHRVNPGVTLPDGKLLSITLPDGAMEGTTVRMEGYGHKLPGMKRGDVVATIRVRPHKWYRTDFYDLHTFHDVDIENAVLGCEATVETPDGNVRIKVPEWSGSNRTVKIPGKGLPKGNGLRGDMVVEIRVMLWDHPDQKVIDLMRSLREGLFL